MCIDTEPLSAAANALCQTGSRNPENHCSWKVEPTLLESSILGERDDIGVLHKQQVDRDSS